MKRAVVSVLASVLLAVPAAAVAQTAIPTGQSTVQLLTTAAALEAQIVAAETGQSLACAALFSAGSVKTGQPVALAWGSVGALNPATSSSTRSMWTQDGGNFVTIQTPGTWTYSFTFYDGNGNSQTCDANIVVTK